MRSHSSRQGFLPQGQLLAGAIIAFMSVLGFLVVPIVHEPEADMTISPKRGVVKVGETFDVVISTTARTPVNVFKGEIGFDHTKLSVESISYNTSLADLWAEEPWYQNGDGTLGFIGGTTMKGGFLGDGTLITVTFRSLAEGQAPIHFYEARILAHDGLGSDVPLRAPLDSIFQVEETALEEKTVAKPKEEIATVAVLKSLPSTDLNGDGEQTLVDVSIFMRGLLGNDPRHDFNGDGSVNTKDLSILLSTH